jgi:urea carboxylase
MPIYDPKQQVSYLSDFMILFKPGDIVKFKPVDRDGYDAAIELVNAGRFEPMIRPVAFSLDEFHAKPAATNEKLLGALHGA